MGDADRAGLLLMYKGELNMGKASKITKRYMNYCTQCGHLSFQPQRCEECGGARLVETPRSAGLTNLACISMSVMDFEAMKEEFMRARAQYQIG